MREAPFEVGKRYKNRLGEYEVLDLENGKMEVRYIEEDEEATLDVPIQRRIWQNIRIEARIEEMKALAAERRRPKRGRNFRGLKDHDFQKGVKGTSWRRKTTLAGLLARMISNATGEDYEHYPVYGQPEVHIALPERYDKDIRTREAKFTFDLDPERVRFGFNIVKKDGPLPGDGTWDWRRFLDALDEDEDLRAEIHQAMWQHNLHCELWMWEDEEEEAEWVASVSADLEDLIWEDLTNHEEEAIDWETFISRLDSLDEDTGCALYICADMPKDSAIIRGEHIAEPAVQVFEALEPLYDASTDAVNGDTE
jgi:hypothetical protein